MDYEEFAKEFINTAVDEGYDTDKLNVSEAIKIAWLTIGRQITLNRGTNYEPIVIGYQPTDRLDTTKIPRGKSGVPKKKK